MNDQTRSAPPDYSKINPIKQVKTIENYRGYKKILFLRPFANTYLGYLDDDFFGFTVRKGDDKNMKYWLMEPQQAVDYYLDRTFFHNPVLEYDTFRARPEYHMYLNALKLVKEGNKKE